MACDIKQVISEHFQCSRVLVFAWIYLVRKIHLHRCTNIPVKLKLWEIFFPRTVKLLHIYRLHRRIEILNTTSLIRYKNQKSPTLKPYFTTGLEFPAPRCRCITEFQTYERKCFFFSFAFGKAMKVQCSGNFGFMGGTLYNRSEYESAALLEAASDVQLNGSYWISHC